MTHRHTTRRTFLASAAASAAPGARAQTGSSGPARRIEGQGVDIDLAEVAELADIVRKETAVWERVIREANIPLN